MSWNLPRRLSEAKRRTLIPESRGRTQYWASICSWGQGTCEKWAPSLTHLGTVKGKEMETVTFPIPILLPCPWSLYPSNVFDFDSWLCVFLVPLQPPPDVSCPIFDPLRPSDPLFFVPLHPESCSRCVPPPPCSFSLCPLPSEQGESLPGEGCGLDPGCPARLRLQARDRQTESSEERRAGRFLYRPARSTRPKQGLREGGAAGRHLK